MNRPTTRDEGITDRTVPFDAVSLLTMRFGGNPPRGTESRLRGSKSWRKRSSK